MTTPTTSGPTPGRPPGRSARGGFTVRTLLVALASVPLAGAAVFAIGEFRQISQQQSDVDRVVAAAQDHVEVTKTRSFLLDERNWMLVSSGIRELGMAPEVVESYTGIDTEARLATARARVDERVAGLGVEGLADDLEDLRSSPRSSTELSLRYVAIERSLAERSDAALHHLVVDAGDIADGGRVIAALRVLELATEARHAMTSQLGAYFGSQFPDVGAPEDSLAALAAQHSSYVQAMARLDGVVEPGTDTFRAKYVVEYSNDVETFDDSISQLLTSSMAGDMEMLDFSTESVLGNLDEIVAVLRAADGTADVHLELVGAAAADVVAAGSDVSDMAAADARRTGLMLAVLAVGSIAFAIGLGHFIGKPLRRLAQRARQLRDGHRVDDAEFDGPIEVQEADGAIDEASAHLALAERQAHALAAGDLAHPALSETTSGQLGASLQDAVRTLATSLDEREEFRQRLAHEAAHDGLTSLPNRSSSLAQLRRALARTRRNDASLAVLFLDLDGFKDVNDRHGHLTGDAVLAAVANRLRTGVREGDHLGRLGGDEFIVVAEPVEDGADAVRIAERIGHELSRPLRTGDLDFELGASIGVAVADPSSDLTEDELLRDADLAVYKAKRLGRGRIELCDETLRAEVEHQASVEESLRRALERDEFVLHFQPIVERGTAAVVSFEALLRWLPPGGDPVPPGDFIPLAERSDLIIDIDNWVISTAARQLREWSRAPELEATSLAINVSARHFASGRFVGNILDPLRAEGVDPARLIVEVTESALLSDLDAAARRIQLLRDAGVRVAIDDYGTGYTSLAYLRALPVDIIKIDRSFVADPSAESLVELIVGTGHLIGASITAEGVETEQQAALLSRLGCDRLQGFYFGRPQPLCEAPDGQISTSPDVAVPG